MKAKKLIRCVITSATCLLLFACSNRHFGPNEPIAKAQTHSLSVATWNVEHLAYPIDSGCKPRSAEQFAKLQDYAKNIQADIVGLQEVASEKAVHLLFPEDEWIVIMSQRADSKAYVCRGSERESTQQKVAFAVRKSVALATVLQHEAFSLDSGGLRRGLEIQIESDYGNVAILNVHMKSGCFVDNYARSNTDACLTFAKQAPLLDAWLEEKEKQGLPYMIIGDFNHRLSAPYNHLTQQLSTNTDNTKSTMINTTAPLIGCHPYYPAPIDHILIGHFDTSSLSLDTEIYAFDNMEPKKMLSDHCAVSLKLTRK